MDGNVLYFDAACLTTVGNLDLGNEFKYLIYPNPTDGVINVKANSVISQVRIFDAAGRLVKNINGNNQEEIVELGSTFFIFKWVKYISKAIILPLFNFLNSFNLNYGIIIILMIFLGRILG